MRRLLVLLFLVNLFSCERGEDSVIDSTEIQTRSVPGFYVAAQYTGQGEKLKVGWTINAYEIKEIVVTDKYYEYFEHLLGPFLSSSGYKIFILPHEGSYKIEITYVDKWNSGREEKTEILYYKYSKAQDSKQVFEDWTPKCNHDYSRFDEIAYLTKETGGFNLRFFCFGEYTMVATNSNDHSYKCIKDIIHNGPIKTESIDFSGGWSDSFDIRFYSKECALGPNKCTNYMQLFVTMSTIRPDPIVYFSIRSLN